MKINSCKLQCIRFHSVFSNTSNTCFRYNQQSIKAILDKTEFSKELLCQRFFNGHTKPQKRSVAHLIQHEEAFHLNFQGSTEFPFPNVNIVVTCIAIYQFPCLIQRSVLEISRTKQPGGNI